MIYYEDIGITPFINASGTITTLGGSLMRPEVLATMTQASRAYVDLFELNLKAGEFLAQRIGVEAAHISCGAASGIQLVAAACLTGTALERVQRLPHTRGWRNQFVISLVDAHYYVHQGIEVCGGKLVRGGSRTAVTTQDIIEGISPQTAAVVHFLGKQTREQLEKVVVAANARDVPVVVDAAAQLPPRSNLVEILGLGAAAVVFSGGKGMRGPQNTGLVLGNKKMLEAVGLNGSPHSAIGRGMKVGKEEIKGLVQAVDLFMSDTDEEDLARWQRQATRLANVLEGIAGITARVAQISELSPGIPRAIIEFRDQDRSEKIVHRLRSGDPPIVVYRKGNAIIVDFMTINPGEEEILEKRFVAALAQA